MGVAKRRASDLSCSGFRIRGSSPSSLTTATSDGPPSLVGLETGRQAQDAEHEEPPLGLTYCHLRPAGGSSDHA